MIDPDVPGTDLKPLFDTILNYVPARRATWTAPPDAGLLVDYNEFVGRIGIGRMQNGVMQGWPGCVGLRLAQPRPARCAAA